VSQTVEWRLNLPAEAGAGLAPGQPVQVHFAGAASSRGQRHQRAPGGASGAVLRRGELTAVYAEQDQHFVLKAVRLGAARATRGSAGRRQGR
jgi:hypothetical protein